LAAFAGFLLVLSAAQSAAGRTAADAIRAIHDQLKSADSRTRAAAARALANLAATQGQWRQAADYFGMAIKEKPYIVDYVARAHAFYGAGQHLKALAAFRHALEQTHAKDRGVVHRPLALFWAEKGQWQRALAEHEKAVKSYKDAGKGGYWLIPRLRCLAALDKDDDEVRAWLGASEKRLPGHLWPAWSPLTQNNIAATGEAMGDVLLSRGDGDDAMHYYALGIELGPLYRKPYAFFDSTLARSMGWLSTVDLGSIRRRHYVSASLFLKRALLLAKAGEADKAVDDLCEAMSRDLDMLPAGVAPPTKEQWTRAAEILTAAIARQPDLSELTEKTWQTPHKLYVARAKLHQHLGRTDKAAADWSRAIEINPEDASAYVTRGMIRQREGDIGKALGDYKTAEKLTPDDKALKLRVAWLLVSQPDHFDAKHALRMVESAKRSSEERGHGLLGEDVVRRLVWGCAFAEVPGETRGRSNAFLATRQLMVIVVESKGPTFVDFVDPRKVRRIPKCWRVEADAAKPYRALEESFKKGRTYLQHIKDHPPADGEPDLYARTRALSIRLLADLWRTEGDYRRAIVLYDRALKLNPKCADSLHGRGLCLAGLERWGEAIDLHRRALGAETNPVRRELYTAAIGMFEKRQPFEYPPESKQTIAAPPKRDERTLRMYAAYIRRALGRAEQRDGKNQKEVLQEMIGDLERAIALCPEKPEAYFLRGEVRSIQGDQAAALADCNRTIERKPTGVLAFQVYFRRGKALRRAGKTDEALADLSRAIELKANDAEAYHERAHAWEAKGDEDQELADNQKALELGSASACVRNSLAWAYVSRKEHRNPKEALKLATEAVSLTKRKNAGYLDTLACAYAENGDFAKAIETEQEALKLIKEEEDKQDYREMIEAFKKKMTYIQYQEAKKQK